MAPKRERLSSSDMDDIKPILKGKQKKAKVPASPSKTKTSWTPSEETKFKEAINVIVKRHLWAELKSDEELSKRGANGVSQHWIATYKKMRFDRN